MTEPDPARGRFVLIQVVRFTGVAMVLVGLLIAKHRILPGLPAAAGILLVVVGLVDVFVMPVLLARKWRTPE